MTQTFVAYYARDKNKSIAEQSPKIAQTLRSNGRTAWQMTYDKNYIIMKGTVDGEDHSNSNS